MSLEPLYRLYICIREYGFDHFTLLPPCLFYFSCYFIVDSFEGVASFFPFRLLMSSQGGSTSTAPWISFPFPSFMKLTSIEVAIAGERVPLQSVVTLFCFWCWQIVQQNYYFYNYGGLNEIIFSRPF
jgi:hypothetical protein